MLLHGVKDTEFDIFHGDTLLNEWDMMREQNPAKKPSFDAIVRGGPVWLDRFFQVISEAPCDSAYAALSLGGRFSK
jgi:hypothetical protein